MTKPKTLRPIRPNAGLSARYRKALEPVIAEMVKSAIYWLTAGMNKHGSRMANDASPSIEIRRIINNLAKRWQGRFDNMAKEIATAMIAGQYKATDNAFQNALRDAGWTVKMKMTPAILDSLSASIVENVNLIKSIPDTYFSKIESIVMRNYASGGDTFAIKNELIALTGVTKKRAALIARDQVSKANSNVNKTRALEVGITDAIWMHSHAGKEPRQSHVKANGKQFKLAEGCLIDGQYIQAGELINCRCTHRSVLPF